MSNTMSGESFEEALAAWKREKRVVLGLAFALLAVGLCLAVRASLPSRDRTIEARQFVLHDDQGFLRARLGLDEEGYPRLTFYDARGREQFAVESLEDFTARMEFFEHGVIRARLMTPQRGLASLDFFHHGPTSDWEPHDETVDFSAWAEPTVQRTLTEDLEGWLPPQAPSS